MRALAQLDPRTPRGMLAAMVERHPAAPWSDADRDAALDVLAVRNVMLSYLLTGRATLPVNQA